MPLGWQRNSNHRLDKTTESILHFLSIIILFWLYKRLLIFGDLFKCKVLLCLKLSWIAQQKWVRDEELCVQRYDRNMKWWVYMRRIWIFIVYLTIFMKKIFSKIKYLKKAHSNRQGTMQILEVWWWLKWWLLLLSGINYPFVFWIGKLRI